jgi:hypothetical protein
MNMGWPPVTGFGQLVSCKKVYVLGDMIISFTSRRQRTSGYEVCGTLNANLIDLCTFSLLDFLRIILRNSKM